MSCCAARFSLYPALSREEFNMEVLWLSTIVQALPGYPDRYFLPF